MEFSCVPLDEPRSSRVSLSSAKYSRACLRDMRPLFRQISHSSLRPIVAESATVYSLPSSLISKAVDTMLHLDFFHAL
jgi:hypothetical protein